MKVVALAGAVAAISALLATAPAQAGVISFADFDDLGGGPGATFFDVASADGWTAGVGTIEIQHNNVAGLAYSGSNLVELDSNSNSTMFLNLAAGTYTVDYFYSPSPNVSANSNGITLSIGATLLDRPDGLIRFGETYIFIDGGKVTSVDTAYLPGSLWSGGFGARVNLLDSLRANLEVAYPLWAPDTIKSPRVTASLTSSF